ncbi:DUF2000 domain-containing protein [Shewanella psychropiezotolerans]|uniref:DUF2000 domain-containing protein n=1 Tax=Shewanella psychropiezotolerans TaxID=2593655 RepID=A0ABX5X367_9GAMM|nr:MULTISPECIES: DUF2000 domain-containing protein [Shewanella]MPY23593.1 DUF2000 domain-containing protein [Shewanella sp. YLB-07]QDO85651.1 DUF2000 domain-containing protein [Shewanella psychropiezotolerans]
MNNLPDETKKRFVAILNKKMDAGRTVNVLGHISVGLSNLLTSDDAVYIDYTDQDSNLHSSVSHFPFIVLKADNSNKIRKVREESIARGIKFTVFTHTMIEGGSIAQLFMTKETPELELNYLGICLFGETEVIREVTKKFSLYS